MREDTQPDLDFDDRVIADNYDRVLVPLMFEPWALVLLERLQLHDGMVVLDLACGTGVVTQQLARQHEDIRVIAADISPAMLAVARTRIGSKADVEYVAAPADALPIPDAGTDAVICQQGFQFFPDKDAAAKEIFRVLKPGGQVALATWCPLEHCNVFNAMHAALKAAKCEDAAEKIKGPFNFMPGEALRKHFEDAGFTDIRLEQPERGLEVPGGTDGFLEFIFASPVAAFLQDLDDGKRGVLRQETEKAIAHLNKDGVTRGKLVANVLVARRN